MRGDDGLGNGNVDGNLDQSRLEITRGLRQKLNEVPYPAWELEDFFYNGFPF